MRSGMSVLVNTSLEWQPRTSKRLKLSAIWRLQNITYSQLAPAYTPCLIVIQTCDLPQLPHKIQRSRKQQLLWGDMPWSRILDARTLQPVKEEALSGHEDVERIMYCTHEELAIMPRKTSDRMVDSARAECVHGIARIEKMIPTHDMTDRMIFYSLL